jgi:hypothetical protein
MLKWSTLASSLLQRKETDVEYAPITDEKEIGSPTSSTDFPPAPGRQTRLWFSVPWILASILSLINIGLIVIIRHEYQKIDSSYEEFGTYEKGFHNEFGVSHSFATRIRVVKWRKLP